MTNWTDSHDKRFVTVFEVMVMLTPLALFAVATIPSCAIPHDFGMHNNLKTICHVWEGSDGYRRQATVHVNSSKNTHKSHPWDYDGRCEE